jgi:hypothetical protein
MHAHVGGGGGQGRVGPGEKAARPRVPSACWVEVRRQAAGPHAPVRGAVSGAMLLCWFPTSQATWSSQASALVGRLKPYPTYGPACLQRRHELMML